MRGSRILFFLVAALMIPTEQPYSQEANAARYLESIQKAYAGLRDYTCDVRIHFDLEGLDSPDMQAKVYYKSPDRIKVDSKGVLFLPREGAAFNPGLFKPEDYDVIVVDRLEGGNAVRLRLAPKKIHKTRRDIVLTIDIGRKIVREVTITQPGGRDIKAEMTYATLSGFNLPTHARLQLDIPPPEPGEGRTPGPFQRGQRRVSGTVDITYANYRVNAGLSDSLFEGNGTRKSKE